MSMLFDLPEAPAKGRRERISGWTKLNGEQLWTAWRGQFESDDEAIITAVWMMNRLIKNAARATRRRGYSIKDAAIARYGSEGRRAREEKKVCWGCDGTGEDEYGDCCYRCDGTGVYSSRWLYLHEFTVARQRYSLHSYQTPKVLLEGESGDAERFGGTFSEGELKALALPMSGLMRLLSYVAAAKWGMKLMGGVYV